MSEIKKILVAYDGSDCAENAIDELVRAGFPRKGQASIVYVQEKWLPKPVSLKSNESSSVVSSKNTGARMARADEDFEVAISTEQEEKIEQAKMRFQSYFPEWKIYKNFLSGSPSREIVVWANNSETDLIVVGCQGKTNSKLHAFGSVSQKIANEAPCSVRIVRGRVWKQSSPNRILIGLDGTGSAIKAVREVASRMWLAGSEVRLVLAKDSPEIDSAIAGKDENDLWVKQHFDDVRKILAKTELKISELIEEGNPKQIITRAADEWGADCIFVGANNGLNFVENNLLGSVSTAVAARSHCTVEIVR